MEAAIIVTYRCIQKCAMCRVWEFPTRPAEEFKPELLKRLPSLAFCNITGGEPFLRDDLDDIVAALKRKARRIVISTNGYLTERILDFARGHKGIGIRVSLEGLAAVNDRLRGLAGSFDHGLRTIRGLKDMGVADVGFGMTISDENHDELLKLYRLAKDLGVEFATAAVHNSFYFHAYDNALTKRAEIVRNLDELIRDLLKSKRPKNWYRAYFNRGLAEYVRGNPRLLPCTAATDVFFLDPWGEVYPCNGLEPRYWMESLGNLHEASFEEIWNSEKAASVRAKVRVCPKNCWMIGTASPAMKKRPWRPTLWIIKNKIFSRRQGLK